MDKKISRHRRIPSQGRVSGLMATIVTPPVRPENLDQFRQARLLLLLDEARRLPNGRRLDIERISYYVFFAAHPFLVASIDDSDRRNLALAGFDYHNLSYQSSGQRFANNRARLQF